MSQPTNETWRPILGFEGLYEVSDRGRVRSLDRLVTRSDGKRTMVAGRLKAQTPDRNDHLYVDLVRECNRQRHYIHRLVLHAFVGEPVPGQEGCHNDGDARNNRVSNLRWDSRSENVLDMVRHGTHNNASKTHCPQGHEYTPQNTNMVNGGKSRQCRTCNRAKGREFYRRNTKARSSTSRPA